MAKSGEFTQKVLQKKQRTRDPIADAKTMQSTINKLRGTALIPRGVYRFSTVEEADEWMIKEMARTRARLNSKKS